MKGFIYIIKDSITNKFYIGSTDDLERRLNEHKHDYNYTTKRMKKKSLVFSQEFKTLRLARKAERKIKSLKRKDYIDKIIKDGYIKITV